MCGILGALNYASEKTLRDALKELHHRGPNDSGYSWLSELNSGIAHVRLSIIDLSDAGHQPMFTEDKSVSIVYNGEVYNFQHLRIKYLSDIQLKSSTDTEVVLQLYLKFGIEFVKKLNGDFAFAICDKRLGKTYLVRDHFGVKPLYYYRKNKSLLFASEIKAILALGADAEIETSNIADYFVFKYTPGDNTLFKNIKRLPPAHYLVFNHNNSTTNIVRYWQVNKIDLPSNYSDLKNQLFILLNDSVNMRLMSDVPLGTFFSGGIDSSIIASFVKGNNNIKHYTARKDKADIKKEGTTSDYEFAKMLASDWGLNLQPIDISSNEANAELIAETLFYSDDLIADGSQIPSYLITKEASKTSTVILSGMGADELFCGYKGHIMALLAKRFSSLPNFVNKPIGHFMSKLNPGKGAFKAYKRHLKQFGNYANGYGNSKYGLYSIVGDFENALSIFNDNKGETLNKISGYFENDNNVFDNLFRFELDNFLVKNLHYTDRMCMANSVEGRVPFLDKRIADFAFSLPQKYKISNSFKTKVILKDTFKDVLPKELVTRRKAGFGMPLRSILSDENKANKLLDISFFSNFNYFNTAAIKQNLKNHISGIEDNSALLYALISYRIWYLKWINN